MSSHDVIIIGSGAGGGTLARRLAPSGKRILLLERGDWLPREPANWSAGEVFVENRYISPDTWYDADGKAFQPQVHYYVGGATKLYGAALYRMRSEDFGELRHHDGISPAWPIGTSEMEPYYTMAEQLLPRARRTWRGPDRTRCERALPVPGGLARAAHPAARGRPAGRAGLHPFHAPCGVMLDEPNMPYSQCVRCSTCDGFPCLVHAKSDAEVLGVRPALEHPNVTLHDRRPGAGAPHEQTRGPPSPRSSSRATGSARATAPTSSSCPPAPPTQRSCCSPPRSEHHPNGLANGSDQVGRNYMFHNSQAVLALSKEPNPTVFQKTLGVNDYYLASEDVGVPDGQHPDGRQVVRRCTAERSR